MVHSINKNTESFFASKLNNRVHPDDIVSGEVPFSKFIKHVDDLRLLALEPVLSDEDKLVITELCNEIKAITVEYYFGNE